MKQKTFCMLKPLAVSKGYIAPVLNRIHENGFRICAIKMQRLTRSEAEMFYEVHKEKDFFKKLVEYMISGPVVACVLEKENAVKDLRVLMGNTNPLKADKETLRADFGEDITHNSIHGSDSVKNAEKEIFSFFSSFEMF